jgi:hypothetical protein
VPALEFLAYPALMAAIYGAYRVGKSRAAMDPTFERMRVAVLALLLGVLILVQWKLFAAGIVRSFWGVAMGTIGIACTLALVAIHLLEIQERKSARPSSWLTR